MIAALLLAAAAACPDRPSKANGACTVPVGHWQLEVSASIGRERAKTEIEPT